MKHANAIVLAAGLGLRFKSEVPKPLVEINSKAIIIYSLEILNNHPLVRGIIVTVNAKNSEGIISEIKRYRINKAIWIIKGGIRRQDSVYNALKATSPKADLVLIHDAARPFIDARLVSRLITQASKTGSAIVGVPVKATIKRVKSRCIVEETLNRDNLWEIQTPQVFRRDLIFRAYQKFRDLDATDDSMLIEKLGSRVSVVKGSYNNIKITTPEDLILAEGIAKEWNAR
jgi:2-C-methyl-D-erythritol 4-phosphate cytidylyltransferase